MDGGGDETAGFVGTGFWTGVVISNEKDSFF